MVRSLNARETRSASRPGSVCISKEIEALEQVPELCDGTPHARIRVASDRQFQRIDRQVSAPVQGPFCQGAVSLAEQVDEF